MDVAIETENINKKYLDFYIKDTGLFSLLNKKFSKTSEIASYYSIVVVITKKEGFLFTNTFRTACDTYIVDFIIFLVVGMILGNYIFGYSADMFGRKKVLIVALLVQVIGGLVVFGMTYYIVQQGKVHNDDYTVDNQMFDFKYEKYSQISDFISNSDRPEYSLTNLNGIYRENFNAIKKEVLSSYFIMYNYKK